MAVYYGLALGYVDSPVLCYKNPRLFFKTLSVQCIKNIMLVGVHEEEMANTLEALVRHMYSKGWGVNLMKFRALTYIFSSTGIPHFITLCFIALHCCVFFKMNARPSTSERWWLALLGWSGTNPAMSSRYACIVIWDMPAYPFQKRGEVNTSCIFHI